jgi:hypothetical protein
LPIPDENLFLGEESHLTFSFNLLHVFKLGKREDATESRECKWRWGAKKRMIRDRAAWETLHFSSSPGTSGIGVAIELASRIEISFDDHAPAAFARGWHLKFPSELRGRERGVPRQSSPAPASWIDAAKTNIYTTETR